MSKKAILSIILIFVLSFTLSACTGQESNSNGVSKEEVAGQEIADQDDTQQDVKDSEEKNKEEESKEETSQEIVAGLGRDAGVQYGYGAHPPLTRVLETLIGRDVELSYKPGLAKSWDVSEDGLKWTLELQEGVKFHDGSAFNSEVVKQNLIRVSETSPDLFGKIESINAVDEYTIEVVHSEPFAPFLYSLAWPGAAIIAPSGIDEEGNVLEPIGTGPYKRTEWVTGEKLILEKNKDYWNGEPILEKITLKNIPDATTRMLALEAGEIDMIIDTGGVLPEHVAMLETNPEVDILTIDGAVPHYMSINTTKAPFDDVNVRKAVMYAINPENIINYALEGYGKVMQSITPHSESAWMHPEPLFEYNNQDEANRLLKEAGWEDSNEDGVLEKDGKDFNITFLLATGLIGRWPYLTIAEIVQEQLGEIGITVEIKVVETGLWKEKLVEGDADLSIRPWAGISPQTRLQAWLHSEGGQNIAMGINLNNSEIDNLIDKALATTDESKAKELLYEVQEMAAKEVSVIPIYDEVLINAVRNNVEGYKLHPWFHVNWEDIYLSGQGK